MNLFSLTSFLLAVACIFLAGIIFWHSKSRPHMIWGAFNVSICMWAMGTFFAGISKSPEHAEMAWRWAYGLGSFVPIIFYHFIYSFCELKKRDTLRAVYLIGILFVPINFFAPDFIITIEYIFNEIYYHKATPLFTIFMIYLGVVVFLSFKEIISYLKIAEGSKRTQTLYILYGFGIGWGGGITTFLPAYGIHIYPIWHFLIFIYVGIITYAILRHQFLDVRVVLTRSILPIVVTAVIGSIYCLVNFRFNLFSMAGFSLSVLCFLLAFVVFAYARQKTHRIWAIFNVIVALWGLGTFLAGISSSTEHALMSWRLTYLPCTFISIIFYHLVCSFCGLDRKRMLIFAYLQGFLFLPLIALSKYFINSTIYAFDSIHYHKATILFSIWLAIWGTITFFAFFELHKFIRNSKGVRLTQASYLFWGMLLGFTGGSSTVIPSYNLPIYPAWHFTICIYAAISTYAIFKYQIMDIKIVGTRLGIFVVVYSLVLGIPFGLEVWGRAWLMENFGKLGEWLPMLVLLGFATAGPFIYLFLQRKAEDHILQEQHQYQNTLRQASMGMTRIKDLDKLLNLMVHILSRTVHIEHCAIYLLDGTKGNYVLKASRGIESEKKNVLQELEEDSILIKKLKESREIIVHDEIKQQAEDVPDENLLKMVFAMKQLEAELIVPSLDDENLIAVIVLGRKKSGEIYSPDDLFVFSVLANQSAIGIENALFYEETGKGLAEKFHEKRLKFLGELGSGLAHQIDNRFNVMSVAAGIALSEINAKPLEELGKDEPVDLIRFLKEALQKIEKSSIKGKEIAEAIKTYSRASVVPNAVTIEKGVISSLNLLACKFKIERLNLRKEYEPDTYVWANLSTLQEVLSNAIDNSHDAMTTKKKMIEAQRLDVKEYTPELIIRADPDQGNLVIEIIDNGIGMTPEQLDKIFVPFFTTKGASKGTGMGMNMMKQLVEKNNGTVTIQSEYGQGTTIILSLPLATKEQIDATRKEADES